jgi:hypothetical protein
LEPDFIAQPVTQETVEIESRAIERSCKSLGLKIEEFRYIGEHDFLPAISTERKSMMGVLKSSMFEVSSLWTSNFEARKDSRHLSVLSEFDNPMWEMTYRRSLTFDIESSH